MQQKALYTLQIQQFRERGKGGKSLFFSFSAKTKQNFSNQPRIPDGKSTLFLVIWIKLKGQRLDSHEQEHDIFAGNFSS